MTALNAYQRLESTGLWHPAPEAQRLDVIVSVGSASLTITDHRDSALAHWSLPAVERINPGQRPALFRPGPDAVELLEVSDDDMVGAIETIRRTIERRRPHPGRLRQGLTIALCLAIAAVAALWLPPAMERQAVAIVPPAKRADLGEAILGHMQAAGGTICAAPEGRAALDTLAGRLFADEDRRVDVMLGGVGTTAHLPGGHLLVSIAVVDTAGAPAVLAGHLLAEDLRATEYDPLQRLLDATGFRTTVQLLTTGDISPDVLEGYAQTFLTAPAELPDPGTLGARLGEAGIPAAAFADAIGLDGAARQILVGGDPGSADQAPLLDEAGWAGLQAICEP